MFIQVITLLFIIFQIAMAFYVSFAGVISEGKVSEKSLQWLGCSAGLTLGSLLYAGWKNFM